MIVKQTAMHFLLNIKLIASAINKFKDRTKNRPIKFVTSRHYEILNDKCHIYNMISKKDDFLSMLLAKTMIRRHYYKFKIWFLKAKLVKVLGLYLGSFILIIHFFFF